MLQILFQVLGIQWGIKPRKPSSFRVHSIGDTRQSPNTNSARCSFGKITKEDISTSEIAGYKNTWGTRVSAAIAKALI